jgi:hypothetical protein
VHAKFTDTVNPEKIKFTRNKQEKSINTYCSKKAGYNSYSHFAVVWDE